MKVPEQQPEVALKNVVCANLKSCYVVSLIVRNQVFKEVNDKEKDGLTCAFAINTAGSKTGVYTPHYPSVAPPVIQFQVKIFYQDKIYQLTNPL